MSENSFIHTPAESALLERFKTLRDSLPGGELVRAARDTAIGRFAREGLPHRRVEEWKYTDLRSFLREVAPRADRPDDAVITGALAAARVFQDVEATHIDFVNGYLAGVGPLPDGVTAIPLAQALAEGHPLPSDVDWVAVAENNPALMMNTAFVSEGLLIRVAAGQDVALPLHLRFVNQGDSAIATTPRVFVVVEKGASASILESHEGLALTAGNTAPANQANTVVELVLGEDARCEHARVNAEAPGALILSSLVVSLGARAELHSFNLVAGAAVSRHQIFVGCKGEDVRLHLGGVTVVSGREHADTTLVVDHAVPGGESREQFRTVVDGDATGVFQGKIIVRPDAQKTDGRMMSAALLLSEGATMNNKPELEIWADDVQCAHGATCGELDDELLFYLMARGLPRAEAEALMLQAFVGEAFEMVDNEAVRDALVFIANHRLENRSKI